jgi:ABC-type uncharacterized transport system involved in gliding motility auxiliary subunit
MRIVTSSRLEVILDQKWRQMLMPGKHRVSRVWSHGFNAVLSSVVFLGILVFVILIAERHSWRLDLTESGQFTLSQQSRKILASIQEPVTIKAFFATAEQERSGVKDLLESYHYHNQQVSFEFLDPDRQPELARRYEIRSYGTLVLEGYQKTLPIQRADEESISNALLKLKRQQEKKVYFLIGHGERDIKDTSKNGYSSLVSALEKENYQVDAVNLLQSTGVPEDAAEVIIAGPRKPLLAAEIESLKQYLHKGGKLFVLLDPYQDGGLKDFLQSYGLQLYDDIVIDKLSRVFGGSFLMPVVTQYGVHKITEAFNIATFYPEARSIRPTSDAPEGVHREILASTSQEAWSEMDQDMLKKGQAGFDEKVDLPGPVPLTVLAEIETADLLNATRDAKADAEPTPQPQDVDVGSARQKAYLVVRGNSGFADNTHFGLSGNGDLFLNVANFLAEEETLITIEPREKKGQPLILTQNQARLLFWVSLVLVPFMILLAGFTVYRARRSQR